MDATFTTELIGTRGRSRTYNILNLNQAHLPIVLRGQGRSVFRKPRPGRLERRPGFEPGLRRWQRLVLPLHHIRLGGAGRGTRTLFAGVETRGTTYIPDLLVVGGLTGIRTRTTGACPNRDTSMPAAYLHYQPKLVEPRGIEPRTVFLQGSLAGLGTWDPNVKSGGRCLIQGVDSLGQLTVLRMPSCGISREWCVRVGIEPTREVVMCAALPIRCTAGLLLQLHISAWWREKDSNLQRLPDGTGFTVRCRTAVSAVSPSWLTVQDSNLAQKA